ncbi:flippase [Marivirga atlantica]|uniref:Lipopolysaccharide biosynthesis protein n=1 Tax=Marivirga atlantica TaxID=1548457 RepID=A0A937AHT1_9BACT|nr:polysaccharide biosynthesis C-terminal domain-containing protein [Marivirga atlantica]MBL0766448.1 lipopolysaccharide biosynthesis protein [Marivirga atlantica]
MIKKLFSHTAIYGLAPQITKVASFFSLPLITQELTELDYGVSAIIGAYTGAISVFAVLGLRVILVNTFFKSKNQYKWAWRQIYGFLTIWNFIYALILALLLLVVIPQEASENRWLILFLNVTPLVFFGQTKTICSTYYQLKQKPFQIAIRSLIFGLLSIGLNVLFIVYYKQGYMGWFYSNFIVGIINNISFFIPLNLKLKITPIFNFKWKTIRKYLKVSIPVVPHYYSSYLLNSSDKVVMNALNVSTGDVGKYGVSYTAGNIMQALSTALTNAVGPLLASNYGEKKYNEARYLTFISQITMFSATFILALWVKEIFQILIRNENLASMYYLGVIIVMSYNYRPMYVGANSQLMFNEKTHILWKVSFMAGVINIILNLILIPLFGFEIAAITTFVSYMFMGYTGFLLRDYRKLNPLNYFPFIWLVITILLTFFVYQLKDISVINKALVTIASITLFGSIVFFLNKKLNGIST